MECGKQVFFQNGLFYIQDENGNCLQLRMPGVGGGGGRGRQGVPGVPGAPGDPGPQGPAGPNTVNVQDEGGALGPFSTFNYIGAGVTVTDVGGGQVDITIPGAVGSTPQLFGNALFVDTQFGNDATAIPFSLMDSTTNPAANKYQTITAAVAAAGVGDAIIVYPGEYTEDSNLYKDGVTFYFYPDANVTNNVGNIFQSSPGGNCGVFGEGNFSAAGGSVIAMVGGELIFHANDILATFQTIFLIDGNATINVRNITSLTRSAIQGDTSTVPDNLVVIHANDISTFSGNLLSGETIFCTQYNGEIFIYANRLIGSPNWAAPFGLECVRLTNLTGIAFTLNVTVNQIRYIATDALTPDNANTRGVIGTTSFRGPSVAKIKGDIYSERQVGIATRNTDGRVEFTGNIYCVDQPAYWSGTTGDFGYIKLNGEFYSSNASVTEGTIKINVNVTLELDGKVTNLSATGPGIHKVLTTSTLILNNLKVITGGGTSLDSPVVLNTYRGIWAVATNTARVNMLNAIAAGPVDYTDALVI